MRSLQYFTYGPMSRLRPFCIWQFWWGIENAWFVCRPLLSPFFLVPLLSVLCLPPSLRFSGLAGRLPLLQDASRILGGDVLHRCTGHFTVRLLATGEISCLLLLSSPVPFVGLCFEFFYKIQLTKYNLTHPYVDGQFLMLLGHLVLLNKHSLVTSPSGE